MKHHTEFSWCTQCAYYDTCYDRGFAAFLSPECGNGPVSQEEATKKALEADEED